MARYPPRTIWTRLKNQGSGCLQCRTTTTLSKSRLPPQDGPDSSASHPDQTRLATPRELVNILDQYVVGQERAKKVLSVSVYNHYNRVRANVEALSVQRSVDRENQLRHCVPTPHPHRIKSTGSAMLTNDSQIYRPFIEKSNVLVIGPTGTGKTLLVNTLARVLDVPFSISDATTFTQAGYVGDDVDICIIRLFQNANNDPARASIGIVYIDEVDKIARKTASGIDGSRDVGGEGVQQALLRMMEGSVARIPARIPDDLIDISDVRSKRGRSHKSETFQIDTSNVLFIFSGAFEGLSDLVYRRTRKGSIGFTAALNSTDLRGPEPNMAFFTPNTGCSSTLLHLVEPTDLTKYGFIPEFVSRLPTIATLSPLTSRDLKRILNGIRGSLVSQYQTLFEYSGVDIRFTSAALDEICKKALDCGGGARGLRRIMEALLLDAMYDIPGSNIRYVLIDAGVARGEYPALYWMENEGDVFWDRWKIEQSIGA